MNTNLAYQDELYNELIDGEIMLMSPSPLINHNRVSGNIYGIFWSALKDKSCEAFNDNADLFLDEENRFIPDCMVVCDKDKIKYNGVYGAPDLVVKVLSPSTARNDKGKKKDAYEKAGVREYWIVDPENKAVDVFLLKNGKYILDNVYIIYPEPLLEKMTEEEKAKIVMEFKCSLSDNLVIKLADVFDRVD